MVTWKESLRPITLPCMGGEYHHDTSTKKMQHYYITALLYYSTAVHMSSHYIYCHVHIVIIVQIQIEQYTMYRSIARPQLVVATIPINGQQSERGALAAFKLSVKESTTHRSWVS